MMSRQIKKDGKKQRELSEVTELWAGWDPEVFERQFERCVILQIWGICQSVVIEVQRGCDLQSNCEVSGKKPNKHLASYKKHATM